MNRQEVVTKIVEMFADRGVSGRTADMMLLVHDLAHMVMRTREAVVVNDTTGNQLWDVDPILLIVDDEGYAVDYRPLDAVLEVVGPGYHAVWYGTDDPVVCAS